MVEEINSIDEAIEKGTLKDIGKLPKGIKVNTTIRDEATVLMGAVKRAKSLPSHSMARASSMNRALSGFHPIRKRLSMFSIGETKFSGQALTYNDVHYFEPKDYAKYDVTYTTDRVKAKGNYTQSIGEKEKSGDLTLSKGESKTVTSKEKINKSQTVNCSAEAAGEVGFLKDSISEPFDVGLLSYELAGLDEYPIEGYTNSEKPKLLKEYSSVDKMWNAVADSAKKRVKNGFFGIYPEGKITVLDGVEYKDTYYRVLDDTVKIKYEVRYTYKPKEWESETWHTEAGGQYFILWMKYEDDKHCTGLTGKIDLPKMTVEAGETTDWYSKTINIPAPLHGELFATVGALFLLCETKRFKLGSLAPFGAESEGGSKESSETRTTPQKIRRGGI